MIRCFMPRLLPACVDFMAAPYACTVCGIPTPYLTEEHSRNKRVRHPPGCQCCRPKCLIHDLAKYQLFFVSGCFAESLHFSAPKIQDAFRIRHCILSSRIRWWTRAWLQCLAPMPRRPSHCFTSVMSSCRKFPSTFWNQMVGNNFFRFLLELVCNFALPWIYK